jgi:hypothetical protein
VDLQVLAEVALVSVFEIRPSCRMLIVCLAGFPPGGGPPGFQPPQGFGGGPPNGGRGFPPPGFGGR